MYPWIITVATFWPFIAIPIWFMILGCNITLESFKSSWKITAWIPNLSWNVASFMTLCPLSAESPLITKYDDSSNAFECLLDFTYFIWWLKCNLPCFFSPQCCTIFGTFSPRPAEVWLPRRGHRPNHSRPGNWVRFGSFGPGHRIVGFLI